GRSWAAAPESTVTYIFWFGWTTRELRLGLGLSCATLLLALYDPPWIISVPKVDGFFNFILVTVFMNSCTKETGGKNMCITARLAMRVASLAVGLCLFPSGITSVAQEAPWQTHFNEANQLSEQGRYSEALSALSLAVAEAEKLGSDDPRLVLNLKSLADLYKADGRYGEADRLLRRALVIQEM